ncbi:EAL domain-containing protein [Bradyrhizobium sp. 192]|uniref:EAL domain-containing protein n=1 Tax=Bradyrhizobium sp. 192 TaxID=2782660 RepID=UPI001FFF87D2|nr:EAL domain-containing protein [Bradyrhizobium sp. 192]UPJ58431.1 EAL domain-containing protein [Bradyrhizobium sp. 192]
MIVLLEVCSEFLRPSRVWRGSYHFYREELDARIKARRQIKADLRVGLAKEQFELCYQPIVDLKSGEVKRCEALLRWHHPVRGMVPPAEFIPVAEECGLISQLGHWALRNARVAAARGLKASPLPLTCHPPRSSPRR